MSYTATINAILRIRENDMNRENWAKFAIIEVP